MNLNIRKTIGLLSLLAVLIPSSCLSFLEEDEEIIKSSTPGIIRHIAVVPGQQVKRGDLLYIVDVMKMFVSITAPRPGFIGSLYFMMGQRIENDVSLITILPFMPVGKGGDPMDVDESPLPILQSKEPSIKDLCQNDLREITEPITRPLNEESVSDVSSPELVMAATTEQSIPEAKIEHPISQQEETLPLLAVPITETFDSEENASDVSSPKIAITLPVEQSVSEDEPQTPQQEETLPLVVAPITETFDNEGEGPDISLSDIELEPQTSQREETPSLVAAPITSPFNVGDVSDVSSIAGVIASVAKQSISEHQPFQQASTSLWIAAVSSHHNLAFGVAEIETFNDEEGGVFAALQKAKAEELRQGNNNARTSTHLFWLTGLLLLGFLFFRRSKPNMPYRVKDVLALKAAENLNIPGYLRDAA